MLGGIIVSVLTALFVTFRYRLTSYHLQRLLGFRFAPDTCSYYLRSVLAAGVTRSIEQNYHPSICESSETKGVPCLCRAALPWSIRLVNARFAPSTYIASLLGKRGTLRPLFVSDIEANSLWTATLFRWVDPDRTTKRQTFWSSPEIFLFVCPRRLCLPSGQELPYTCGRDADHGFILRVTPPEFRKRSWIVCAGLGEWGSSGSAWYLANRWETLITLIHPWAYRAGFMPIPDFLAIIRVVPGQDQSARLEALYRKSKGQTKKVK